MLERRPGISKAPAVPGAGKEEWQVMPPIQNSIKQSTKKNSKARTVIVLNASWEALNRVSLHRALAYLVADRAEVVHQVQNHTVQVGGSAWPVPTVVRLVRFVKIVVRGRAPACSKQGVLIRDGHRCAFCGKAGANTVDHVQPRSRGGASSWLNLVAACGPCNSRKADRTPAEAGMHLLVTPKVPSRWATGWLRLTTVEESMLVELGVLTRS